MSDQGNEGDYLSPDEVAKAFEGLSAEDKLKLHAVESVLRRKTGFGKTELVQEAFCLAFMGSRRCPRNVPIMAFLVQTMRSVASHDRAKSRRTVSLDSMPEHAIAQGRIADCESEQLTPEEHLVELEAEDTVKLIHEQFDGDEEAQLMVMAWSEGRVAWRFAMQRVLISRKLTTRQNVSGAL